MSDTVKVTVPATTANLGPGFDCLGMAVSLRNELTLQTAGAFKSSGQPSVCVTVEGLGADTFPTGAGNLIAQAAIEIFSRAKRIPERLTIRSLNRIPPASGMGSSASAIVGGLVGANEICRRPFTLAQLLDLAARLEGHPDNVAPALYGGLTISVLGEDGKVNVMQPRVRSDLTCVFCTPSRGLSTTAARRALPKNYSRQDVVFSLSRAAMLTAVLQGGDISLLRVAMQDRIHQPYRAKLIPGMCKALESAEKAGALGACLSGSGPTVLALVDRNASSEQVGNAMAKAFQAERLDSKIFVLNMSRFGARATFT